MTIEARTPGDMVNMACNIRQVVYSSGATHPMSSVELAEILQIARYKNEAKDITGMLLYRSGHFLQVLEGPEKELRMLLEKLERDPRHRDLRILLDGIVPARAFGAWSMAFEDVSGFKPEQLPAYSQFLTEGFSSTECVRYPQKALRMVLAFRDLELARI
jgi:hypothetical protein